jgi:hydrogenase maturation factor HypF (carbamoyltransferase family)
MDAPKLEQQIIALYSDNLVNLYSINQIAKKLQKTYPFINKKVTQLLELRILNKIVIGKSYLCSLNFDNEKTILYLALRELEKKRTASETGSLATFLDANRLSLSIQLVVKYNGKMLFVVENLKDRREIQRAFPTADVCDKKEFLDLLVDDAKLFTNHTILYGAERFYELLKIDLPELKRLHSPLRY